MKPKTLLRAVCSSLLIANSLLPTFSFAQKNMTLRSKVTLAQMSTTALSNIWGYTDSLGNEYALVGTETGVSIIDITNPDTPLVLFNVPGPNTSIWREIATYGKYAYVGSDNGGPGLRIIDLSNLPSSYAVKTWNGDGIVSGQIFDIHTLRVDGNFLYLFGGTFGYPLFIDLSDPWNPQYAGRYIHPGGGNTPYVHDGYVRNDTGFFAHIYVGFFTAVDLTDKSNPVLLATQSTPTNFTHNVWLSDNSKTIFTTDETNSSYLTTYDISNFTDIKELDRVQFNTSGSVVHNTHVLNDYSVTSWYKDGVVIVDGNRPANLVVVGYYDTSPLSGTGMDGDWGVYPYFPSGTIIASDIDEGMFVLTPDYKRACYLEGIVTDSVCGDFLNSVTVEILTTSISTSTDLTGEYKFGTPDSGTYDIRFSKAGYTSKTVFGVILTNGVLTNINIQLKSLSSVALTGQVVTSGSNPVANAEVILQSPVNTYTFITDAFGNFSKCNIVPDNYEISAGKWNYITECITQFIDSATSNLVIELDPGIYDDFTFDFGWTVSGNAATGIWERGIPIGTDYIGIGDANPGIDVSTDCSDFAYVTGNAGGGAGTDDVDDGITVLTSPVFDLSSNACYFLNYYRWFFNDGGAGSPNDTLHVKLTNGTSTVIIESVDASSAGNSSWVFRSFKISDYITPTATMQIILETSDLPVTGHLVEAGVDKFEIIDSSASVDSTSSVLATCGFADGSITIYAGGGTPPLQFSIDTGSTFQTGNTFDSLAAGVYSIIIADSLNCTATILAVVNNIAAPAISIATIINVSCNGFSDGSIVVSSSGGAPPYQYSIDGGPFQADSSFTTLPAGSYLITVKDTNGCISSVSQLISQPATILAGILSSTNESSPGASDGTASVSMSGGTTPYTYSWSPGSQTTAAATGLTAGVYTLTVNDANGCIFVDSISVSTTISGINEFIGENANINVFPNPFNESTQIEYKLYLDISTDAKMLILDLSGRSVIEIPLTSKQGTVTVGDDISEGVYFLRIINGKNFSRTVKLVK